MKTSIVIAFGCLVICASVPSRADEKYDKGIPVAQVMKDFKIKKTSSSPICKTSRSVRYVRIKPNANGSVVVVGSSAKEANRLVPKKDQDGVPFVDWAGDLNGDGFNDLLLGYSEPTSDGAYIFVLLVNCGRGKYVAPFPGGGRQGMRDPHVLTSKT